MITHTHTNTGIIFLIEKQVKKNLKLGEQNNNSFSSKKRIPCDPFFGPFLLQFQISTIEKGKRKASGNR